ncbi:MAG: tetratricopeptide repeat protein [Flavobacteriaceae bacterium]
MKKVNLIVLLSCFVSLSAQQTKINKESNNLTLDGNIEYVEDNLIEAEALYRKSISKDSMNLAAKYNLGNSFYSNKLNEEALNQYRLSIKNSNDKSTLHKSYHNLGNLYMQSEDYQNAMDSFKNALLNNPEDDETRYNYVLAKELLKNQDNNKKDDKDNKNDKDKKDNKENKKGEDKEDKKEKDKQKNNRNNDTDNSDKNKKPRQNKISPNQLENLLKAMDNEEKNVLKKVNKNKMKGKPIKNKKDW